MTLPDPLSLLPDDALALLLEGGGDGQHDARLDALLMEVTAAQLGSEHYPAIRLATQAASLDPRHVSAGRLNAFVDRLIGLLPDERLFPSPGGEWPDRVLSKPLLQACWWRLLHRCAPAPLETQQRLLELLTGPQDEQREPQDARMLLPLTRAAAPADLPTLTLHPERPQELAAAFAPWAVMSRMALQGFALTLHRKGEPLWALPLDGQGLSHKDPRRPLTSLPEVAAWIAAHPKPTAALLRAIGRHQHVAADAVALPGLTRAHLPGGHRPSAEALVHAAHRHPDGHPERERLEDLAVDVLGATWKKSQGDVASLTAGDQLEVLALTRHATTAQLVALLAAERGKALRQHARRLSPAQWRAVAGGVVTHAESRFHKGEERLHPAYHATLYALRDRLAHEGAQAEQAMTGWLQAHQPELGANQTELDADEVRLVAEVARLEATLRFWWALLLASPEGLELPLGLAEARPAGRAWQPAPYEYTSWLGAMARCGQALGLDPLLIHERLGSARFQLERESETSYERVRVLKEMVGGHEALIEASRALVRPVSPEEVWAGHLERSARSRAQKSARSGLVQSA